MALEDVVEGWFDEYEQSRSSSLLYRLVSSSIRLTSAQTGQRGNEAAWQQLLDANSSLMTESQKPHKLILAYLQWRLPLLQKVLVYPELRPEFVVDELEIMLYASGLLPRIMNGERVYVKGDEQIGLMSFTSAKVGGDEKDEREDMRFYRLVMRVAQRHYRDIQNRAKVVRPGWNELVIQVLKFPPLQHLHSPQDYAKEEAEVDKRFDEVIVEGLTQYMRGARAVQTASGRVYIEPLRNLQLLSRPGIQKGVDNVLRGLLRDVRSAEKNGGPAWGGYLDRVGALDDVVKFHYGIILNRHIIVGRPTEQDDYTHTKFVALGIVPATYRGKTGLVREAEDLCMLIGFRKDFRSLEWCAKEIVPVFRRAQLRYEQETGKSPMQLMNAVLADEEIKARYGALTAGDIYRLLILREFKEYIRPRLVGELPFISNGREVWIRPMKDLQILMPGSKFADPELKSFGGKMSWHERTLGFGYWNVVEGVLAEPEVVGYHGRALTRNDASPSVAKAAA